MAEDKEINKKTETLQARLAKRLARKVTEDAAKGAAVMADDSSGSLKEILEDVAERRKLKKEISAAFAHIDRVRARAQKRQAEIDRFKKETRALIKEMKAA